MVQIHMKKGTSKYFFLILFFCLFAITEIKTRTLGRCSSTEKSQEKSLTLIDVLSIF